MDSTFNLGRHEALIESLVSNQEKIAADVADIKTALAEQRGAARFKSGLWGVAGGILSAVLGALFKGHFGTHA